MRKVYVPELERRVSIPDYCILCSAETRYGQPLHIQGKVETYDVFVCTRCLNWAYEENADLEEAILEQLGDT